MTPITNSSLPRAFDTIVYGGLTLGALDCIAATVIYGWMRGVPPLRIWQGVASGLIGAGAREGGWNSGALGLTLHFVIALIWATAFFAMAYVLPALASKPFIVGPLYGIFVFWFMQLVVLPLSNLPVKPKFTVTGVVTGILIHMICVGPPPVFFASRSIHR